MTQVTSVEKSKVQFSVFSFNSVIFLTGEDIKICFRKTFYIDFRTPKQRVVLYPAGLFDFFYTKLHFLSKKIIIPCIYQSSWHILPFFRLSDPLPVVKEKVVTLFVQQYRQKETGSIAWVRIWFCIAFRPILEN